MYISYEVREAAMARARLLRARAMHRFAARFSRRIASALRVIFRAKPVELLFKN